MDLTIIIVNWNVKEFLRRCLLSVYRFTQATSFEVFVVDNNSSDGSADMVRTEFPQAHLIANNENYGFSKANNQALNVSAGRYILLLNPDTELIDNSPKAMVEFMDKRADIDAIGAKLIYPQGDLQRSCRSFPSLFTDFMENLYLDSRFPKSLFFNHYRMGNWRYDGLREIDQPAGACLLFRQKVTEDIGLLDERFFMYYDEVDFCYRIKKSGGKIYYVPDIKVIHYANMSTSQIPDKCLRYYYRSKLLFFRKHYGRLSIAVLFFNLIMRNLLDVIIFPLSHVLCGRPRGLNRRHFEKYLKLIWQEYLNFLKN